MASGPQGSGIGWTDFANTVLNPQFTPGNIHAFAAKFKQKHGPHGNGDPSGLKPYKFGHFVDKGELLSGTALGQFMIDSGRRHWDGTSLDLLEYTIKHSLTAANPQQIIFAVKQDTTGASTARAEIKTSAGAALTTPAAVDAESGTYMITIWCPRNNPRPNP